MKTDFEEQADLAICRIADNEVIEKLTMRDLFAAFALAGIIASDGNPHAIGEKWAAAAAYDMADAMLVQRGQSTK